MWEQVCASASHPGAAGPISLPHQRCVPALLASQAHHLTAFPVAPPDCYLTHHPPPTHAASTTWAACLRPWAME